MIPGRREWLQQAGLGLGALGLAQVWADAGDAQAPSTTVSSLPSPGTLRLRTPRLPARATRVIHFFLNGGPSQVDTFDPKPALQKYAGKPLPQVLLTESKTGAAFPSPFKFQQYGQSGIPVSELFARTAQHVDEMAVIRSMYGQVPNHEPSLMLMNCGNSVLPRPSVGSWVLYGLGTENQNLPGFVAMCPMGYPLKAIENWQSAFLPGAFQGTYIDPQRREVDRLIENIRSPHATTHAQRHQLDLLMAMNRTHQKQRPDERLDARIQSFELAFRMQVEAAEAFDLARESQQMLDLYGDTMHGRQTLIARRLVERGVRYVQLWHGPAHPWDSHTEIEKNHRQLANELDQPLAALITDLKQRGMLDDTLIIWGGEFGRTPTVELTVDGKSQLGRDHNHYGFSVWMAGGGVRGGTIYGSTDDFGFKALENPTSVHDLHATILHLLGLNHEQLTFRYAGRDFRLTDVSGKVIREIIA